MRCEMKYLLISLTLLLTSFEIQAQEITVTQIEQSKFYPFELIDNRESEWSDVRISFSNWDWLKEKYGNEIEGYYLNGYGIQGLVLAARILKGLPAYSATMEPMSEGDTCFILFGDYSEAIETVTIASEMINDKSLIMQSITVARDNGFEE